MTLLLAGFALGFMLAAVIAAIEHRRFLRKLNAVLGELDGELTRDGYPTEAEMSWDAERFEPGAYAAGREAARKRSGKASDCPHAAGGMAELAWQRGFKFERAAVERRRDRARDLERRS